VVKEVFLYSGKYTVLRPFDLPVTLVNSVQVTCTPCDCLPGLVYGDGLMAYVLLGLPAVLLT